MRVTIIVLAALQVCACSRSDNTLDSPVPVPDFVIARGQEHYAFSRTIPPVIRVHDGAIIEVHTQEASDGLVVPGMTVEAYRQVIFPDDFGHPLAGPVYVEGAESGDILAVTLHQIELEDWGWTDTDPHWAYQGDTNLFLYESTEFTADGNFEGGVRLGVTFNDGKYRIMAFGRNITDEENLTGAIDFNNLTGFINEPRTFGLQLTARYD